MCKLLIIEDSFVGFHSIYGWELLIDSVEEEINLKPHQDQRFVELFHIILGRVSFNSEISPGLYNSRSFIRIIN